MNRPISFKKNEDEEQCLAVLNDALQGLEERSYQDLPESFPTVHVIGVPRAGTTLATQFLAANLEIGYISQLIAAFWKAPTVGIRLSKKLMPNSRPGSYASRYGRTEGILAEDLPCDYGR